ncbi:exportin-t [Anaeramoeba flamelloides]|uniref:Exportin-T n=1 Tax=Anaeramoeba flamelloides TaxID=1746091 RepID=A0AAV7ZNA4_9EUKA|nr:exportin-t [Anaeramoeba flamelloides]
MSELTDFEKLEKAVLIANDPMSDPNLKEQIILELEEIKSSKEGLQLAFEGFFLNKITSEVARFFCLTILVNYLENFNETLTRKEKETIQNQTLNWITESDLNETHYFKNKVCQLIIIQIRSEYPENWKTPFEELFLFFKKDQIKGVDIGKRIVSSLEIELFGTFGNRDYSRSLLVQDEIIEEGILEVFITFFFECINSYFKKEKQLINDCWDSLTILIEYVEVSTILNEDTSEIFMLCLLEPNYQYSTTMCLIEIISKKFETKSKFDLLQNLKFAELVPKLKENSQDYKTTISLFKFMNSFGMEYLNILEEKLTSRNQDENELNGLINIFGNSVLQPLLEASSDDDYLLSKELIPFLTKLINYLKLLKNKSNNQYSDFINDLIELLLNLILVKMVYPKNYLFQSQNDILNDDFEEYRLELSQLFRKLSQNWSSLIENFVFNSLKKIIPINNNNNNNINNNDNNNNLNKMQNINRDNWNEIEIVLELVYILGEKPRKKEMNNSDNVFSIMIDFILNSNFSTFDHFKIVCKYFKIISRYYEFLLINKSFIPNVLMSFLDKRGIRNPSKVVRNECCNLFLKFVKDMKTSLIGYLNDIITNLSPILTITNYFEFEELKINNYYTDEELHCLFESVSLLISLSLDQNCIEERSNFLEIIILPIIELFQNTLNHLNSIQTFEQIHLNSFQLSIKAIESLTRGFHIEKLQNDFFVPHFKKASEYIYQILLITNGKDPIRDYIISFLHQIPLTLGNNSISLFTECFSILFNTSDDTEDFIALLKLLGQYSSMFKQDLFDFFNESLINVLNKIMNLFQSENSTFSEVARQNLELKRSYYSFLVHIVQDCPQVFVSEKNIKQFLEILDTTLNNLNQETDIIILKKCAILLLILIKNWFDQIEGFDNFAFKQILPMCLLVIVKTLDLNQFDNYSVMKILFDILFFLFEKSSNDILYLLSEEIFPSFIENHLINDQETKEICQNIIILLKEQYTLTKRTVFEKKLGSYFKELQKKRKDLIKN